MWDESDKPSKEVAHQREHVLKSSYLLCHDIADNLNL
jgi:hypothetical protein